ncbi:MAG: hypothetical protein ACN6O6_08270 [Pseudomonas sp.]|uniref:hypothetical protein n=1 Tax=Pseudomonas sp. TaxID=306 RepID=UPI003D0C333E
MRTPALFLSLVLGSLVTSTAFAEACYVTTRSSSEAIPKVEKDHCYEFVGAAKGDIDWSCSNESTEVLNSEKRKVERCEAGSQGRCEAALTQEALANHRSTGDDEEQARPAVPNDAKVITHYYNADDLAQARTDCESSGGTWQQGEE